LFGDVATFLLHGDVAAWLVLGHRELTHVSTVTATYARDSRRWRLAPVLPADWPLWPMLGGGQAGDSLLYTEGEAHRQRSEANTAALGSVDPIEFRARTEQFAEQLLSAFAPAGEAELMSRYAQQLPVMALGWALGVPAHQGDALVAGFSAMLSGGPVARGGVL
ncbi:cytochrome P450, partial [Streptomyces sp. NPDC054796]